MARNNDQSLEEEWPPLGQQNGKNAKVPAPPKKKGQRNWKPLDHDAVLAKLQNAVVNQSNTNAAFNGLTETRKSRRDSFNGTSSSRSNVSFKCHEGCRGYPDYYGGIEVDISNPAMVFGTIITSFIRI